MSKRKKEEIKWSAADLFKLNEALTRSDGAHISVNRTTGQINIVETKNGVMTDNDMLRILMNDVKSIKDSINNQDDIDQKYEDIKKTLLTKTDMRCMIKGVVTEAIDDFHKCLMETVNASSYVDLIKMPARECIKELGFTKEDMLDIARRGTEEGIMLWINKHVSIPVIEKEIADTIRREVGYVLKPDPRDEQESEDRYSAIVLDDHVVLVVYPSEMDSFDINKIPKELYWYSVTDYTYIEEMHSYIPDSSNAVIISVDPFNIVNGTYHANNDPVYLGIEMSVDEYIRKVRIDFDLVVINDQRVLLACTNHGIKENQYVEGLYYYDAKLDDDGDRLLILACLPNASSNRIVVSDKPLKLRWGESYSLKKDVINTGRKMTMLEYRAEMESIRKDKIGEVKSNNPYEPGLYYITEDGAHIPVAIYKDQKWTEFLTDDEVVQILKRRYEESKGNKRSE